MKRKILLVEDNPGTIEVMTQELGFLGYEVAVVTNGAEALERLESYTPDLVIMDIRMPKMDGFRAAAGIRTNPNTRNIPLLASTAMAMPGDREKCLGSGFDGYIAKPFTHKELGAAIDALLGSKS
jgi:CheY-like chemotaxis protein